MIIFVVYPAEEYKNRPANARCKEIYIDKIIGSLQMVITIIDRSLFSHSCSWVYFQEKRVFFWVGGSVYFIICRERNLLPGLNSENAIKCKCFNRCLPLLPSHSVEVHCLV